MSAGEIVLVAAAADNGVIGAAGAIPWHLPADLRRFRRLTMGQVLLMGRKTFESIGRPLPGRRNIVLSRQPGWSAAGTETVPDIAGALRLAAAEPEKALMVIGGAAVYAAAAPLAQRLELTRVHISPAGDTFFASPGAAEWRLVARTRHDADGDAPACSFETYLRAAP